MVKQVVSFSGGKDSTALAIRMIEEGYQVDELVFFDTGWEFPQMAKHVRKVQKYIGMPITILKPKKPFLDWMLRQPVVARKGPMKGKVHRIGNGWPSHMRRWCTRQKISTIDKYLGNEAIRAVGIAADEAHRADSATVTSKPYKCVYPLIDWGMTEADCLQYCYDRGFDWDGLYNIFPRVSCFCCPLQRIGQLKNLRHYFPELWKKMLKWDSQIPVNRGFRGYDTVQDLEERFAMEDLKESGGLFDTPRRNRR